MGFGRAWLDPRRALVVAWLAMWLFLPVAATIGTL